MAETKTEKQDQVIAEQEQRRVAAEKNKPKATRGTAAQAEIANRAIDERTLAASKALDSLGRYKFEMFGYHASNWVKLNRIIGDEMPNPFIALVKMARAELMAEPEEVSDGTA